MHKIGAILLMSLAMAGANAQDTGGVRTSTDPAKAAAVESRAEELKARQSKEATAKSAATHKTTSKSKSKTPTTHKSSSTAKHAKPAKS